VAAMLTKGKCRTALSPPPRSQPDKETFPFQLCLGSGKRNSSVSTLFSPTKKHKKSTKLSILANMDRDALKKQIENMKYQASMERWPLSKSIAA
jgi:hypothetical protein